VEGVRVGVGEAGQDEAGQPGVAGHGCGRPVDGGDPGAFSYVVFDRDTRVGLLILANGDYAAGEASSDELLATLVQRLFALATEYADQRD
jgi:hypothetical protein